MLFNVSGMVQDGIGATREYDVEGTLETLGRSPEPVSGHVQLLRTRAGVLVRAHLSLTEAEDCSRCLRPLVDLVKVDFEEEFKATMDALTGKPVEERPGPEAFLIDSNHMLDLTEAVRQYREASATMQPLCKPDCRGLCHRCGHDLNDGDCACTNTVIDSRLAGLAALLEGGTEN
jgi:uncharacterized protein